MSDNRPPSKWYWLRALMTVIACLAILSAAAAAVFVINETQPTAKTINTVRKSEALVETITVHRGSYSPRLKVLGTVQPAQDIVLSSRVGGQVLELSPGFTPGGRVGQGDLLLRIDPADFENAISIRESELEQAVASRQIERARQDLAEKELKLLEGSIEGANRGLVMREPQIASIEAQVSAAEAAVERAQLDLKRTKIYAPFDAQVISRSVNVGSQVSPGAELAQLVGVGEYWVRAAVPVRSLRWVVFPDAEQGGGQGSRVILRDPDGWGKDVERIAHVARMIGALDEQTRLARVLITVDDPLGLHTGAPRLILNTLIETEIQGRPIGNVVRLPRDLIRDRDTVWVMKDGHLEIRDVSIVFRDAEHAFLNSGLESGDQVVTTTLATVAEGVGLRKVAADSPQDPDDTEAANGEPAPAEEASR